MKTQRKSRPKIIDLSESECAVFNYFWLSDGQGTPEIEQIGAAEAFSHSLNPLRPATLTASNVRLSTVANGQLLHKFLLALPMTFCSDCPTHKFESNCQIIFISNRYYSKLHPMPSAIASGTNGTIETLEVIPDPISLIESMRAVGYTVEAAIADLIDNSISARASRIDVQYDASEDPFVAILDNGWGMAPDELTNAMRHGSHNPTDSRDVEDLGRFGLGLKTASLSQCRKLTVVSKKAGTISARRWDLDVVQQSGRWLVVVPGTRDLAQLPLFSHLQALESGTLVVWQELDRLTAGSTDPQREITTKLASLFEHLALVFHRFTQKEAGFSPVSIVVNGLSIPPRDPFLKDNTFRQPLEGQVIRHERGNVHVSPFVLPPVSHLSPDEISLAGGKDGLRGTQGFYIYRNRRLVIWGTWFRLVPKQEFFKLTRVQVDIPNSFDDLWALDIKKSSAYPPESIRNRLKELIPHFAETSRKTVTYPGRRKTAQKFVPLWIRVEPNHGSFRYELNMDHPVVQTLFSKLEAGDQRHFQMILGLFGDTLPFESIYADMCTDRRGNDDEESIAELIEIATMLSEITGLHIDQVLNIDPIVRYPQYHQKLRMELEK